MTSVSMDMDQPVADVFNKTGTREPDSS